MDYNLLLWSFQFHVRLYGLFPRLLIIIFIVINGKRDFSHTACMCNLTEVVFYERNLVLIHTREEKPVLE